MENKKMSNKAWYLIVILICIAAYSFGIKPLKEEIVIVQNNVTEAQLENRKLNAKYARLNVFGELNKDTKGYIKSLLGRVPVGVEQDAVIDDLYDNAETTDINLSSISFNAKFDKKAKVQEIDMSAAFGGTYQDLILYLEQLELNNRLLSVDSVAVQVGQESNTNFSLQLMSYYQEAEEVK